MSPAASLLLLRLFPAAVFLPSSSSSSGGGGPRWSSQQLEDIWWHGTAQVLPGLLPRRVPQLHVRVELVNQQAHYVAVAVHGGDVERRVAAG